MCSSDLWAGRFSIRSKGRNDFVTEADHAAQEAVQEVLLRRFPDDGFLGEEDAGVPRPQGRRRWIVDPLDGTTNYVHGFPFFCVSIGLEAAGKLVVGVVHDPIRKETFSAAAGGGAWCNSTALHVTGCPDLSDALLSVGLPADMEKVPDALGCFERLSKSARSLRRMGSAALSLAYVAAGRLDGYWAHHVHPWDAAGGIVLVREAGGIATNFGSSEYSIDRRDLTASNGLIHDALQRSLQQGLR